MWTFGVEFAFWDVRSLSHCARRARALEQIWGSELVKNARNIEFRIAHGAFEISADASVHGRHFKPTHSIGTSLLSTVANFRWFPNNTNFMLPMRFQLLSAEPKQSPPDVIVSPTTITSTQPLTIEVHPLHYWIIPPCFGAIRRLNPLELHIFHGFHSYFKML